MKIKVYQNRNIYKEKSTAGIQGENKAEVLDFVFPSALEGYEKYIEIQVGEKNIIDKIEDNKYSLEEGLTQYKTIKAQIILKDLENSIVFKSNIFSLGFNESLNIEEDFVSNNRNILDVIELELKEIKEELKNSGGTGTQGKDGLSAYQIAVKNGFVGTEEDWLNSLKATYNDTELRNKITEIENNIGYISTALDEINGEVV